MLPIEKWGLMSAWIDAFTVHMEGNAEAAANPQLRTKVAEALTKAKADLAAATSDAERETLGALVANQQAILDRLGKFDLDAYRQIITTWRMVRPSLESTGWDLREEVDFEQRADGTVRARQGKGPWMAWTPAETQIVLAFFAFVNQTQDQVSDPVEHVKRTLLSQGITEQNFDQHADRLAISNPWKQGKIITHNFRNPS